MKNMEETLKSNLSRNEILFFLQSEICVSNYWITSLLFYFNIRPSLVCGKIKASFFELRVSSDPFYTIRCQGKIVNEDQGSLIKIKWVNPWYLGPYKIINTVFSRDKIVKKIILDFLHENLI